MISEDETEPAAWTLAREGDTSERLVISASLLGDANRLTDYNVLFSPENLVFEPGQSTLTLPLFPVDNDVMDGTRSAILSLVPGPGYQVGENQSVEITIIDNNDPPLASIRLNISQSEISAQLVPGVRYTLEESVDLLEWSPKREVTGTKEPFKAVLEVGESSNRFFRFVLPE